MEEELRDLVAIEDFRAKLYMVDCKKSYTDYNTYIIKVIREYIFSLKDKSFIVESVLNRFKSSDIRIFIDKVNYEFSNR